MVSPLSACLPMAVIVLIVSHVTNPCLCVNLHSDVPRQWWFPKQGMLELSRSRRMFLEVEENGLRD